MNKAWALFALVVVVAGQFMALSLFHRVAFVGPADQAISPGPFAAKNSVITIAKWGYVDAQLQVTVHPVYGHGNDTVILTFPNGTSVKIPSSEMQYSFRLNLPRSGGFSLSFGGTGVSGPISLSKEHPLTVSVLSNVADLNGTVASLQGTASNVGAQAFIMTIVGAAEVDVFGYGVSLRVNWR